MKSRYSLFLLIGILLIFTACTTQPPKESPGESGETAAVPGQVPGSRYAHERDFAPLRPIRPEEVADASVRPDPILPTGNTSPYTVEGISYEVLKDYKGYKEQGIASWYGGKFTGYETSNGELYDVYKPSAAHRTLPIPSFARVTNLENGKSIVVRVNDRGPFHSERLIDLSYAAAVKLGYMERGTAMVDVEVIEVAGVEDRRDPIYGDYRFIQVGAFGEESTARTLQAELQDQLSAPVFIVPAEVSGRSLYRVRVGPAADARHFLALQQQLQASGYENGQPLP